MFNAQKAQTGARVYLGKSQSPNVGQVSGRGAQGYIQREMRKKRNTGVIRPVGMDGQSDNRSSVAARALRRQGKWAGGEPTGPRGGPGGRNTGGPGGRPIIPPKGKKGPPTQGPAAEPTNTTENKGQGQPVPEVQVNPDGTLVLPYSQAYSEENYVAVDDANAQLLELKNAADAQSMQYGVDKRNAQLQYDALKGQTLNQNASRGTAFSSAYGTAVAQNAGAYANQMSDIEAQNAAFGQQTAAQRAAIQSSLNQQLARAAQAYTDQLSEDAGSLGYGTAAQGDGKKNNGNGSGGIISNLPDKPTDNGGRPGKGGKKGDPVKGGRGPKDGRPVKPPKNRNRRKQAIKALRRKLKK